ncbi:MAG: O-antigen ligase family protein [Patescibacteria group bacterium]
MLIVLILAIIFFLIIAALRQDLALCFIIALLPTYLVRFSIMGIPFTFLEIMILSSFTVWFVKNILPNLNSWLKNRKQRLAYPFGLEIIAIIIFSFMAVAVTGFNTSAMGIWKAYFFEPILLFILILNVWPKEDGQKKIISALLIGAAGTALVALFQQATGLFIFNKFWADIETRRVVSFFGYPNAVGLFLAPLVMIFIGYLFSLKDKGAKLIINRIIIVAIIIASLLSIYFAKSEGAIVGLIAALFLFCLLANKTLRVLAISIAVIASITIISIPSLKTFATDKIFLRDLSGEIRQRQWKETIMALKGWKIITGNGLSGYSAAVKPYHQEGIFFNRDKIENFDSRLYESAELRAKYWQPVEIYMYPHNIFLNFWSELGILGALVFVWLIIKYLIISLQIALPKNKQKNYFALGLFSAMIVIIVHGLVDVPYFKNDLSAMFFIFLSLLSSLMLDIKIKEIKKI